MKKRVVQYLVAVFVFVILLNQLIGFAVTPKPWYERFFITIVSSIAGGGIGAAIGLSIGGIGVALMGTAVGIGLVTLTLTGFGIGALGGSVYTILANPRHYDFDFWKLLLIVVVCLTTAGTTALLATKSYEKLATWLKKGKKENEVKPLDANNK